MSRNREPRSPYARKGKKPYRYSETYYAWREAVKRNDPEDALELAIKHARLFDYAAPVASDPRDWVMSESVRV